MKNRKIIIALLLVAIVGIVGLTFAYFSNTTTMENEFNTKEYGTTYVEEFVSPNNWLPGDTTPNTVVATNTGEVDQAVRIRVSEEWTTANDGTLNGWIHADGTKSTHTSENELATDERVAILNLANTSDWTKVGDYYYYNYKLAPTESTTTFLESVTFNSKTKLDDTCTTSTSNGVTTTACNSSGNDYDGATYTLTLTIETVQYNEYANAWNTGNTVTIAESRLVPAVQYLAENATNTVNASYNATTKGNMFTFTHGSGANVVTESRYIGDAPNNYVYFNCDDISNQSASTCEVWRILGVFDVDDGTGNIEQRMKLVRGNDFANSMLWDDNTDGAYKNDWTDTNASLRVFLNGDYYNASGVAATYGLKVSARNMIGDAKYYLGAVLWDSTNNTWGTTETIYGEERGNVICGDCNSDTTKLTWTGKVGLMYPTDEYMVYGNGVNTACYNNPFGCSGTNATTGWVYNSNIREGQTSKEHTWFVSSRSSNLAIVLFAFSGGGLYYSGNSGDSAGVRPVVYLNADVKISDGDGTSGNPYELSN